jgi:hypothetical protein
MMPAAYAIPARLCAGGRVNLAPREVIQMSLGRALFSGALPVTGHPPFPIDLP